MKLRDISINSATPTAIILWYWSMLYFDANGDGV